MKYDNIYPSNNIEINHLLYSKKFLNHFCTMQSLEQRFRCYLSPINTKNINTRYLQIEIFIYCSVPSPFPVTCKHLREVLQSYLETICSWQQMRELKSRNRGWCTNCAIIKLPTVSWTVTTSNELTTEVCQYTHYATSLPIMTHRLFTYREY